MAVKLDVLHFLLGELYRPSLLMVKSFFLNLCQFAWLFCVVIQQIVIIMFVLFLKCTSPLRHVSNCGNAWLHTGKVHSKFVVLCWMLAPILEYYSGPPVTVVTVYANSLLFLCVTQFLVHFIITAQLLLITMHMCSHTHTSAHTHWSVVFTVVHLEKWHIVMQAYQVKILINYSF